MGVTNGLRGNCQQHHREIAQNLRRCHCVDQQETLSLRSSASRIPETGIIVRLRAPVTNPDDLLSAGCPSSPYYLCSTDNNENILTGRLHRGRGQGISQFTSLCISSITVSRSAFPPPGWSGRKENSPFPSGVSPCVHGCSGSLRSPEIVDMNP